MSTWVEPVADRGTEECEVLVAGGGPSGAAAASAAARLGVDVVLVEGGREGRDKGCGDMFVPAAAEILRQLGLDCESLRGARKASSFDAVELRGVQGLLWKVRNAGEPIWIIPRRIADQLLRDLLPCGVRVLYSTFVWRIIELDGALLQVNARRPSGEAFTIRCQAVVLACGAQDRLSQQWGISGRRFTAPAISAYVPDDHIVLPAFEFVTACRPGYRWIFPGPDENVNIGVFASSPKTGSMLKKLGRDLCESYGISEDVKWRGGSGGLWSGKGVCWHHAAGLISCGDAAGLVDPVNGEGLTAALTSGLVAGEAAAHFLLRNRDMGALRSYSEWVRAHFSKRYSHSAVRSAWSRLCGSQERIH
jgi:menaquinone-9 beta-reductase